MSSLILPNRFTEQPQYLTQIDWSHPAAGLLTVALNPAVSNSNLAAPTAAMSPTARIISANGVAATVSGSVSTDAAVLSVAYSFIVAFRTGTVGTGNKCIVGRGPTSGSNNIGFGFNANHGNASYAGAVYQGSAYSIIGKPTGGVLADNTDFIIGAASASGSASIFYNGLKTGSATGLSAVDTTGCLALGATSFVTDTVTASFACYLQFNGRLPDSLMAALSANPWQIFKAPQRKLWVVGGSGSIFNVSIAESIALSDAPAAAAAFLSSAVEALSLTDAPSVNSQATAAQAESIALSESTTFGAATAASITESVTLADTISAAGLFSVSQAEALTLSDTISASLSAAASLLEAIALSDTPSAIAALSVSMADSITLSDTSSTSGQVTSASVSEAMALNDANSALAILIAAVSEAISLADNLSAASQLSAAEIESLALLDASSASLGSVLAASVAESISLVDNWAAVSAIIGLIESLIRMDAAFRGHAWRSIDRYSRADLTHRSSVWRIED